MLLYVLSSLSFVVVIATLLLLWWVTKRVPHSQVRPLKRVIDPAPAVQVREMHVIDNVAWMLTRVERSDG